MHEPRAILAAVALAVAAGAAAEAGDPEAGATETGDEHPFWELDLRLETDSSDKGPPAGRPVPIPSGMTGDRAFVAFADPAEISPAMEAR